jgi:uncharacterized repeat protein (TIGR03803 family)
MTVEATSPELPRKPFGFRKWPLALASAVAIFAIAIVAFQTTRPERYEVIQNFPARRDGPRSPRGLAIDKIGHVYGSTAGGGLKSRGTIFELTPPWFFGSQWDMRVLSNVDGRIDATSIGTGPIWSMIGQDGDLYGLTNDSATLYKFKSGNPGWGEPIPLHRFTTPFSPLGTTLPELIQDASGSFYGTTTGRGGTDAGTVFKLSPGADGWTETLLHRFGRGDDDGGYPNSALTMDRSGALYGTTSGGGKDGLGTVFKLTPTDQGWERKLLYIFSQTRGADVNGLMPMAGLTLGDDGTLYGTTGAGGKFGSGAVFALTPSDHETWSYRVLYHFKKEKGEGIAPNSRLIFGKDGALYGTTKTGGDRPDTDGFGTVFKLVPTATDWREIVLHSFAGGADGAEPSGALIRDRSGNIFGTTLGGGRSGVEINGTVFEIAAGGMFGK